MPRANRHFLPGYVWHITQRCAGRSFFLRFRRDRRRWCFWLNQVRQRYGLRVLNYIVTSNHVHLLVRDLKRGNLRVVARLSSRARKSSITERGVMDHGGDHATAVEPIAISAMHYLYRLKTWLELSHRPPWIGPKADIRRTAAELSALRSPIMQTLCSYSVVATKLSLKALREAAISEELISGAENTTGRTRRD